MINVALQALDTSNECSSEVEVDQILDKKEENGQAKNTCQQYINNSNQGFPESENSWEPKKNMRNCSGMVIKFEKKLKAQTLRKCSNKNYQQEYGNFDYDDKVRKIVKEKINKQGKLLFEIEWEMRQDRNQPKNSFILSNLLKKHCPSKLLEYLEERLMQMELGGLIPSAQNSRKEDSEGSIRKKVRIPEENIVSLESKLSEFSF